MTLIATRGIWGASVVEWCSPTGTVPIRPPNLDALTPHPVLFPYLPEASHHPYVHIMGEGPPRTRSQLASPSLLHGLLADRVINFFREYLFPHHELNTVSDPGDTEIEGTRKNILYFLDTYRRWTLNSRGAPRVVCCHKRQE